MGYLRKISKHDLELELSKKSQGTGYFRELNITLKIVTLPYSAGKIVINGEYYDKDVIVAEIVKEFNTLLEKKGKTNEKK